MHRSLMAAALPLALAALLLAFPASAQIPKEPALAEPIPPVRPLSDLLTSGPAQEAERFLAAGDWKQGGRAAANVLAGDESNQDQEPSSAAGALTLLALARAGYGDEPGAICRWHAAQSLDPDFRGADLTAYGEPGRLLESHPLDDLEKRTEGQPRRVTRPASGEPQVTRPEIVSNKSPQYSERARKARIMGTVILEAVIGTDGTVSRAKVLKGLPYGLTATSIDAVCDWRFKPATLEGTPVEVFYVLTVNYQFDDEPAEAQAGPPTR